jgi:hypothetical protein
MSEIRGTWKWRLGTVVTPHHFSKNTGHVWLYHVPHMDIFKRKINKTINFIKVNIKHMLKAQSNFVIIQKVVCYRVNLMPIVRPPWIEYVEKFACFE